MSKTFKSSYSDRTITAIRVGDEFAVNLSGDGIRVVSTTKGNHCGIELSRDVAAPLALTILEAAGVKLVDHSPNGVSEGSPEALEDAAYWLSDHIKHVERKAKEAADREALDAEAWAIYQAAYPKDPYTELGAMSPDAQQIWRGVARAAREIHGAKS